VHGESVGFSAATSALWHPTTAAWRRAARADLRHTYAVHTLLRWYQQGADLDAKLPVLAALPGAWLGSLA